jgi:hypothetical protein
MTKRGRWVALGAAAILIALIVLLLLGAVFFGLGGGYLH